MKIEEFPRALVLATRDLAPEVVSRELARFAKEELARTIQSGEGSPIYDRYVNQRKGPPEEAVNAPGPILYAFVWWRPIIEFALAELRKRSPRRSGRYASSFVVIADGRPVTDYDAIPARADIVITNVQPYTRHIAEQRPRIFEVVRSALGQKYGGNRRGTAGAFLFDTAYLSLGSGIHPLVPYVLNGGYARQRARKLENPARYAGKKFPRRKDREAGRAITYPSILISMSI